MKVTRKSTPRPAFTCLILFVAATCCALQASAQESKIIVRLPANPSGHIVVEGDCAPARSYSFRDSYADVLGLGSRVSAFTLMNSAGERLEARAIAPGQYEASGPATRFRYELNVAPPNSGNDAVKVSWLTTDRGVLMLADLLPMNVLESRQASTEIQFVLPSGLMVYSNEKELQPLSFEVANMDAAIFAVGRQLRASQAEVSGMSLSLVADGAWAFTDNDAIELAGQILKAHREIFGAMPSKHATILLLPYQTVIADRWRAETRGNTVTILLGKIPSKVGALAQLSTPLTHELFHLWVPNALSLAGNYDWFYEGFTVYEAARVAVSLNLLTFPEFLNAISRAYDAYAASADRDRRSLIESSAQRWTLGQTAVYQKSMVVAFICDLRIRSQSHGKRSLDNLYRAIFRQYANGVQRPTANSSLVANSEANAAVLQVMNSFAELLDFGSSYVEQPIAIDLSTELTRFGFKVERFGLRTRISVQEQLTKAQRDLLHQLGYNDYVRRSPSKH